MAMILEEYVLEASSASLVPSAAPSVLTPRAFPVFAALFPFPAAAHSQRRACQTYLERFSRSSLAGLVVVVGTLHQVVTSTGAYAQAIALAKSSSEVQSLLGDGIRAQAPAIGFADGSNGSAVHRVFRSSRRVANGWPSLWSSQRG